MSGNVANFEKKANKKSNKNQEKNEEKDSSAASEEKDENKEDEKKPKLTFAVIESRLLRWMNGEPQIYLEPDRFAPFGHKIAVFRGDRIRAPFLFEVKRDRTVEPINEDEIARLLYRRARHWGDNDGPIKIYGVSYRQCREIANAMQSVASEIDWPLPVAWESDKRLTFRRLDFDPFPCDEKRLRETAPVWMRMMDRMGNWRAFCQRLGSLMDPHADKKQSIWVFGPKDSGKSLLGWFIQDELLAGLVAHVSWEDMRTPFWIAPIVGKRAIIGSEADPKILNSSGFKKITGDELIGINEKNEKMRNAKIDAITFFFSNEAPSIPNDEALKVRIIPCRMAPVPPEDWLLEKDLKEHLRAELPAIMSYCWQVYSELQGKRIEFDNAELIDAIEDFESDDHAIFERWFKLGGQLELSEFHRILNDCEGMKTARDRNNFRRFVERTHGVKRTVVRHGSKTTRSLIGVSAKIDEMLQK